MVLDLGLASKTLVILFLAVISPGPDFVMVLKNALIGGRRAGLIVALGIGSGCLISFSLVIGGLKLLFNYPLVKLGLSCVCGVYLIYIGWSSLRSKTHNFQINVRQQQHLSWFSCYRRGLFTNLFNPKLYALGSAILTFTEQQQPNLVTLVSIIVGQAFVALTWFSGVALIFSHSQLQRSYLAHGRKINFVLGVILIALGIRIISGEL